MGQPPTVSGVTRIPPTSRWGAIRPLAVDAGLAAVVLIFCLAFPGPPAESQRILVPIDAPTAVLCVVASALLIVRRRYPWWVWGATTVAGIVGVAVVSGPSRALIPAMVGVYTLSTRVPTRLALAAAIITPLVPVAIILAVSDVSPLEAFAYGLGPWSALAAVSGMAVRSQRAVVSAAHERARLAEESREEEARRRVSEERLRIARDLHDVVAHHIAVINVQAGLASQLIRTDPDQAAVALAHVREAGRVVLAEVPGLLGMLRADADPVETTPAPRLSDLDALVEQARRSGLHVTIQRSGEPLDLGAGAELTAYRIVQESLTNAGRHGAGAALLTVAYDEHGCTVEVRNRVPPEPTGDASSGQHGLTGMRERAASAGGTLTVGPVGADEWVVHCRLDARAGGRTA